MLHHNLVHSKEELHFDYYLEELKEAGIILAYTNNVDSLKLCDALLNYYVKPMKKVDHKVLFETILPEKVYTPDFNIVWNNNNDLVHKFIQDFDSTRKIVTPFIAQYFISLVETKGTWDRNNMTRLFKQNQAWIWDKHKIYINLTKVPDIFKQTFTPKKYLLTDVNQKLRQINYSPKRTLDEFLNL